MDMLNRVKEYILGPGFIPQLLLTIITFFVLQIVLTIVESLVQGVKRMNRLTTILQDKTLIDMGKTIEQKQGARNLIYNSQNEIHGQEFTYSMYVYIDRETFISNPNLGTKMKHIFSKGSSNAFPMMAPGVFAMNTTNTIRIYMNSTTKWDNYVEVPNIPVGKWFHLVIMLKGKFMDVYVNGNVVARHEFPSVPRLNYGHIFIMRKNMKFPDLGDIGGSYGDFEVDGAIKGSVSRVKYYAFAINYAQLDELYREGPNTEVENPSIWENKPPYLRDDWWVTKY